MVAVKCKLSFGNQEVSSAQMEWNLSILRSPHCPPERALDPLSLGTIEILAGAQLHLCTLLSPFQPHRLRVQWVSSRKERCCHQEKGHECWEAKNQQMTVADVPQPVPAEKEGSTVRSLVGEWFLVR